jgi:magnesium transporter
MASSTERSLLRLEKRVADMRQTYDAYQQDRINHHLAVLTILSATFLPLTLMAGIWGMNFSNMPELERENAYFYALASMVGVAIAFLFTFYYHGWFQRRDLPGPREI